MCPGLGVLWLALLGGGPAALAQSTDASSTNTMGLGLTAAPSPVTLLQTLSYTLSVTNFYSSGLTGTTVTNTLPTGVVVLNVTATTNSVNSFLTNGSTVVFFLAPLTNLQIVNLTVAVQPTAIGSLTNIAAVGQTLIFVGTNPPPVTNITAVAAGHIDLGVAISGPADGVLVNDRLQYQVSVTNLGPNAATGVFLTNMLPAGATLLGVSPSTAVATTNGRTVIVRFDSLAAGASQRIALDLQPTRVGLLPFSAAVGTAAINGFIDDNTANNVASFWVAVDGPAAGQLMATLVSPQIFNPQTGLMEQLVHLTNTGAREVPDARVVVSGLTNRLVNAIGTNNGSPFVALGTSLGGQQSVDLLLELFVPRRVAVTNLTVTAIPVTATAPVLPTGTRLDPNRLLHLASGRMLVEFTTIPGHSYAVVYSDSSSFTNVAHARPDIVALADVTQWIDYGPPLTVTAPSNTPMRFYRVLELP